MTMNDTIGDLLAKWEEAWEHGHDIPAAELCADHPELLELVQQKVERLKRMAWMVRSSGGDSSNGDDCVGGDGPDSLLGTTLAGRYQIEAFIAEGGFGRVYKATDAELQRPVAVKVARGGAASREASLLEEARRAAKLRHNGIVPVIDVGGDGDRSFVVSAFIDGPDLAEVIEKDRPSPAEAARIVADIAEALHHAHREGFVHRDLKPENVLLDKGHRPLITDFGLAATFEEVVRRKGLRSGTLMYMSPEQVAGETQLIGPRSDIYSLGVVLYEMLTGRLPYQARTPGALREQILFRLPVPPRSLNPDVPVELEAVCLRCLSKLPADRYSTAAELATALRASPPRRWLRFPLRWVVIALVVVGLFVAGLALGMMLSPVKHDQPKAEAVHEDGVLVFDGQSRIVTPLERFAPVTLEAWVKPKAYPVRDSMFFIGSDVPTKHGLSLGMSEAVLCAEYVAGMTFTEAAVPLNRWSHVAAVFGETETRLYLDGRKVGVGPASKPVSGAPFVVGNVGRGNPINFFVGKIRSVRITKGERYVADFVPDEAFAKDGDDAPVKAVLIYDGSAVEGDRVIDRTGAGNDGRWERTKP
jgi:serine/threonine-protein kinase